MQDNVERTVSVWSKSGLGTGFYIAPHYIVTNTHVIQSKMFGNKVLFDDILIGGVGLQYPGKVVAVNAKADIALIYTSTAGTPVTTYNTRGLKNGDFHYSLGTNLNEYKTAKTGYVTQTHNYIVPNAYVTTALLEPGFSGGGAFDANNVLIGINVAIGYNLVKKYSFIIKFTEVKGWIFNNIIGHKALGKV